MKIIVVGGMGFLGSHICEMFLDAGEEVTAIDNLTKYEYMRTGYNVEAIRKYNLDYLKNKKVVFYKEDVRNKKEMELYCKDADYIINCSAQPSMTISIENPMLDYTTNLTGLLNLLEIARKKDIPIAHCTTIHIYGNNINNNVYENRSEQYSHKPNKINEEYPILNGTITPLHSSKRSGEIYMQSYHDTYGLKTFCARLSGIYGERQFGGEDHGWVANFTIRTIMNTPIKIFGTDRQVRDILYVKDASRLFKNFFKYQQSGIYNCGGGEGCIMSIKNVLDFLNFYTNQKQKISIEEKRLGDLWWFVTDISKVSEKLKWIPTVTPRVGLTYLIDWVKENKKLFNVYKEV